MKYLLLRFGLVLHKDVLLLEALVPCVSVKTQSWRTPGLEFSFVKIPVPDQSKNEYIRYILRPNDCFQIEENQFTVQARKTPFDPEIQVASSRPDRVDDIDSRPDVQSSRPSSAVRPSTPVPGSGVAVMETPMANRHQVPLHETERPLTRSPSSTLTKVPAISDEQASADLVESCESPREDNLESQSFGKPIAEGFTPPGDRQKPQCLESPQVDQIRQNHKRSASHDENRGSVKTGVPNIINPQSALAVDEPSSEDVPRKRQKRDVNTRTVRKGADESQNSVRSTIHVEVPDMEEEHVDSKLGPEVHTCPNCHRSFSTPAALKQHLKRVKGCAKLVSSLGGDELEKNKLLTPIAESKTHLMPQDKGLSVSPELSPSRETPRHTLSDYPGLTEPPSSNRSTRSKAQEHQGQDSSQDQIKRVYYASTTNVGESTVYTRFLRQHNIKPVKSITNCDILCTGNGELKRTSNLILAVLMGKQVVTEEWVIQSAKKHEILDPTEFIPESDAREREWGTTLSAAIERGREGLKPLEGWTINFTPSLKKELGNSWTELKGLCLAAGATVHAVIPHTPPSGAASTVVVATSHEPDLSTLEERGWKKVFTKDIITYSVLRGIIDTESDEFIMKPTKKGNTGGKRKK